MPLNRYGNRPFRNPVVPFAILFVVLSLLRGFAVDEAAATVEKGIVADAGIIGLNITNLGYIGNGLNVPTVPSCEYPLNSNVEHLFLGGIWVGAKRADGRVLVSTGAQDASSLVAGDEVREFVDTDDPVKIWSNNQNSNDYNLAALATEHIEVYFDDDATIESGNHTPLNIKVALRALAWSNPYADDFVILDYAIINESGSALRDLYLGLWTDTTVGNTEVTNPYDSQGTPWNYYDDSNGAWRPGDVEGDPNIWMSYEHDEDTDDGMATSWVGIRLLGTSDEARPKEGVPPVSYNAWGFHGVPATDDVDTVWTEDDPPQVDEIKPGKYQLMGNGEFDVDPPGAPERVFGLAWDWVSILSTGPFPFLAPDDTLYLTYAIVCGTDSLNLLANSKVAQLAYDDGFAIAAGPPSPILQTEYDDNTVVLAWEPGATTYVDTTGAVRDLPDDDPRRSPEHHISLITGKEDFQGYRIYRFQGETFSKDPYEEATIIAEYDIVDDFGYNTGLPPVGADGKRRFTDTNLLDGFPYWYSVVAYSAPDVQEDLPSFQSGFNENALLVYPGPAVAEIDDDWEVGVFPNPYRAGSRFDNTRGERELGRKIWFTNLSRRCSIKIFNLAGDLVKTIQHDDPESGMHEWDILSEKVRAISSGLYIYVVEDLASGEIRRGKLVIIK